MYRTDIIEHQGNNRLKQRHDNYFEQFTFSDLRKPTIYDSKKEFSYWQPLRHQRDLGEYFKSTQNEHGYRIERQDELENRVMTPGFRNFYNEITPERLAHDPEDAIHNYFNGWQKNISDRNTSINMLKSQLRNERKGNFFRVRDQTHRFIYNNTYSINGPLYHPELM